MLNTLSIILVILASFVLVFLAIYWNYYIKMNHEEREIHWINEARKIDEKMLDKENKQ